MYKEKQSHQPNKSGYNNKRYKYFSFFGAHKNAKENEM
jgi:hypothetical protein